MTVQPDRRDFPAHHELHAALRIEGLFDELGEEWAIRRAFLVEQHAAGEFRLRWHRMFEGGAFGRRQHVMRHFVLP